MWPLLPSLSFSLDEVLAGLLFQQDHSFRDSRMGDLSFGSLEPGVIDRVIENVSNGLWESSELPGHFAPPIMIFSWWKFLGLVGWLKMVQEAQMPPGS